MKAAVFIRRYLFFSSLVFAVAWSLFLVYADYIETSIRNTPIHLRNAKNSDLIILGKVSSIEEKVAFFGTTGDKNTYAPYKYVTFDVGDVIKGNLPSTSVVVKTQPDFAGDYPFTVGEYAIVMLRWYETKMHGNYYGIVDQTGGVFLFDYFQQQDGQPTVISLGSHLFQPMSISNFISAVRGIEP